MQIAQRSVPGLLTQQVRPALVAAAALELAADCLECGKVQIYQALVAGQQLVDGSVLRDTALHVSRSFGEHRENQLQLEKTYLGLLNGRPKALFH